MKHQADDDFDQQLQRLAPMLRLRGEFRKHLRQVLRISLTKRRTRRLIVPLLIVFCLGTIFISGHEDRQDPRWQLAGVIVTRQKKIESSLGNVVHSPRPEISHVDVESIYETKTGHQLRLKSVTGWTLTGQTFFVALYEYDQGTEVYTLARPVPQPSASLPSLPPQLLDFLGAHEADVLARIKRHEAETVGTEDRMLASAPVRFTKWRVSYPAWGHVVYWEGVPLPSPKFP